MQDEFLRLQQMLQKTIVFITHDFLEALRIADRMAIMRDGAIVQIGSPAELVLNPADSYVAEFTNEVPRARVLTAADVLDGQAANCDGPCVDCRAKLEELLPRLARQPAGVRIAGPDGGTMGVATAQSVVSALAGGRNAAAGAAS
jgi:glycine betaine/proline transport system ATP-binding protein